MTEPKKNTGRKTSTRTGATANARTRSAAKKPAAKSAAKKPTAKKPAAPTNELFGGAKNVKIEMVEMTARNYSKRALMPEEYPFSQLDNAEKLGDGTIRGQSFFIPETEGPQTHLARARKQLKEEGKKFWTRQDMAEIGGKLVPGLRVWRQSADEEKRAA